MSDDGRSVVVGELVEWLKGVGQRARVVIELQDAECTTFLRVDDIQYAVDAGLERGPGEADEEVILGCTSLPADWPTRMVQRVEGRPVPKLP